MSFGAVMHTTIKRFVDQLRKGVKLPFEEVQRIFETEWNSKGFEDAYQEEEYKKNETEQLGEYEAERRGESDGELARKQRLARHTNVDAVECVRMMHDDARIMWKSE